ncbi:MAG: hypothetical protein QXP49_02565, partial [Nitrososphaerota archaeon]
LDHRGRGLVAGGLDPQNRLPVHRRTLRVCPRPHRGRAAFRASEPGYGSAIGVTVFIFSFVIVQLLIKFTRSRLTR